VRQTIRKHMENALSVVQTPLEKAQPAKPKPPRRTGVGIIAVLGWLLLVMAAGTCYVGCMAETLRGDSGSRYLYACLFFSMGMLCHAVSLLDKIRK
jgi:hypothetical protein